MRVPIPPANSHGALHNPVPKNGSDAGAIAPCCRLLIGRNLTHDLGLENKLLYQKGKNIQFLPSGFHRFFLLRSSIAVLGYLGECTVHFCGEDSGYGVISTMCLRGVPFPIFGRYSWITVDADRLRSTVSYECVQICDTRHYCQFLVSFFFCSFIVVRVLYRTLAGVCTYPKRPLQVPDDQSIGSQMSGMLVFQ